MGGAIFNHGGALTIRNSTLSGNLAQGGAGGSSTGAGSGLGGAIFNLDGSVTISFSTLAANSVVNGAPAGGALFSRQESGSATVTLEATILADTPGAFSDAALSGGATATGSATNIVETNATGGAEVPAGLIIATNGDPQLAARGNNGGPTATHMPASSSPAYNGVPVGSAGCGDTTTVDQRGITRPIGAACDIGAVEAPLPVVAPLITSAAPANGTYGSLYSHTFSASGQPAPSFSVTGGVLPPGLTLSAAGVLSGTPTQAGTFANITVRAANGILPNATQTFTIVVAPAALTVTANAQSRTYGAANPALTFSATGFVNADTTATALTGALATGATATSAVGVYPITQGSLAAANYAISFTPGTLTVANAVLTITADPQSRTYGAANPPLTFSVTGLANGDTAAILTGALETTATEASAVGGYAITQGTLAAPNYAITYTGATLTIVPAPLTITADNKTRLFGAPNPPLTISYSGFVNGEDPGVLAVQPSAVTAATADSPVGAYPITVSGGSATNYALSYVAGVLTITATEHVPCTGTELRALLAANTSTIQLNGACRYQLTGQSGANGHLLSLTNRQNLTLEGNGAIIERSGAAADLGLFAVIDSAGVTIRNLTLAGGQANGPGDQLAGRGGGITLYNSPDVVIDSVIFLDHRATHGGAIATYGGSTTVINSVFAGNQAKATGAAIFAQGPLDVRNNTITGQAMNPGAAIFAWDDLVVRNTLFANHAIAIAAAGGPDASASEDANLFANIPQRQRLYNRGTQISGGTHSLNVASSADQFVDPATHDYRLKAGAAAIDRGLASAAPTRDAAGRSRPFGNTQPDIGAYEYQADQSLRLVKHALRWAQAESVFTIQVSLTNAGRATLRNLELRDALPLGLIVVDPLPPQTQRDAAGLRWSLSELAPGQVVTQSYRAQIDRTVTSVATLEADDGSVLVASAPVTITLNPAIVASLTNAAGQRFDPAHNGFSFAEWRDHPTNVGLTAVDLYRLYGPGVCAPNTRSAAETCVLTAPAQRRLQNLQRLVSSERSFGLAAVSLAMFTDVPLADGKLTPGALHPTAIVAADLARSAQLERVIAFTQAARLSPPRASSGSAFATDGTPADLVRFLSTHGFGGPNNADAYTLELSHSDGRSTTLAPYALEALENGRYKLYVYDPAAPGAGERSVLIDTATDTWSYSAAGGAVQNRGIALRSLSHATRLPRQCDFCLPADANAGVSFTLTGGGRLLITDAAGRRSGYDPATGELLNEIPGTGIDAFSGPDGAQQFVVRVPPDSVYSTAIFSAPGATGLVSLSVSAPGMLAELNDLTPGAPTDPVLFDLDSAQQQVSLSAGDAARSARQLVLAVSSTDGDSYGFILTDVALPAEQRRSLSFDQEQEQVTLSDTGRATPRYDLLIIRIDPDGAEATAQRNNLTNNGGTGAEIDLAEWDGSAWPPTRQILYRLALPLIRR
jgi:hypothetical protein